MKILTSKAAPVLCLVSIRELFLLAMVIVCFAFLGGMWLAYVHTNDMRAQCASRYGGTWIEAEKECVR